MSNKLMLLLLAASLLLACSTQQKTASAPPAEYDEYRELDTMVVSAPRPRPEDTLPVEQTFELPEYNPSHTRSHDLIHTSLDLRFNWEKEQVLGKAALKLRPYFYPSQTLVLDAKGFEFHSIRMEETDKALEYEYDGQQVTIGLGREYHREEEYTLLIDYTATPAQSGGSAAITSDKGLFFINPRGEDPDKPRQIWTQGETENNSRWFPTIDKPNERCTQEMIITVEETFDVLSNGALISRKNNGDGTHTYIWKMDQPHAPYLFMLAIGDFAVVEEEWEGIPVSYYVEPEYEEDARAIFSNTKEMLSFFSDKLKMKYPWPKYAQVVVRDYVSGAMENTTSVIFGDFVQRHRRELIDDNNERIIAHELFHHWFGDLVTCESWANLTMNEGFANYSEYLWFEHQYGADAADYHLLTEWSGYLGASRGDIHPLIHFGYEDKENMFDAHSYNKGGAVLHMLRHYVGDDAFWAALNKYLSDNAYSPVEAHELRLAFEEVSGEDLNWFFNQWYFEQGHPQLNITYGYDEESGQATVTVEQTQDPERMPAIFQLPAAVDIYLEEGKKLRKDVWVKERAQTFSFDVPSRPKLINFDAERMLLAETQDNKTEEELVFQYYNAPKFLDRFEALQLLRGSSASQADRMLEDALKDDFWAIRAQAAAAIGENAGEEVLQQLRKMAVSDPHSQVRAIAFEQLMQLENTEAVEEAKMAIKQDSAYNVIGAALQYLSIVNEEAAIEYARLLEKESAGDILLSVGEIYAAAGKLEKLSFFEAHLRQLSGFSAIYFMEAYQSLAMQGEMEAKQNAFERLNALALDGTAAAWNRFGATRALNEMRQALMGSEEEEAQQLVEKLSAAIKKIKSEESNPQLKSFYDQMLPDIRP